MPEYHGDPYIECRPECVLNSECPRNRACINNKCIDPCPGTCGLNADCRVVNHSPTCSCSTGYIGNPLHACRQPPAQTIPPPRKHALYFIYFFLSLTRLFVPVLKPFTYPETPCIPSPCGPHSHCREVNSHAVCSCVANYFGTPPNCRPECMVSSECSADRACVNQRCVDPCPGTCGVNARCQVVNHNAICSCQSGFVGDPFVRCISQPSKRLSILICFYFNFHIFHFLHLFAFSILRTHSA